MIVIVVIAIIQAVMIREVASILAEVLVVTDFSELEKYENATVDHEESFIELLTSIHHYRPDMIFDVYFSSSHVRVVLLLPCGQTVTDTIDNNIFLAWYNDLHNSDKL